MHLEDPIYLLLLLIIPPIFFILWKAYKKDQSVLSAIKEEKKLGRPYLYIGLAWLIFFSSLSIFIAGPYTETLETTEHELKYGDFVFLVDVSRSMASSRSPEDASSLDQVKDIMNETIQRVSTEAKFQIFTFTRSAFSRSELSNNVAYLQDIIKNGVYINSNPLPGSRIPNALLAVAGEKATNPNSSEITHIILFSDGYTDPEKSSELRDAVRILNSLDIKLVTVGIGSTEGQRIPLRDKEGNFTGDYERIGDGGPVYVSYLNEANLKELATATGGEYFHHEDFESLIKYLQEALRSDGESVGVEESVSKNDVGWMFLSVSTIALLFIVINRKKLI